MDNKSTIAAMKNMIQDMEKRQKALGEKLQEFQALQKEIEDLYKKAPHDTQAHQRVMRYEHAMQGDLGKLSLRIKDGMTSLQDQFKSFGATLKKPAPGAPGQKIVSQSCRPRVGRQFI